MLAAWRGELCRELQAAYMHHLDPRLLLSRLTVVVYGLDTAAGGAVYAHHVRTALASSGHNPPAAEVLVISRRTEASI